MSEEVFDQAAYKELLILVEVILYLKGLLPQFDKPQIFRKSVISIKGNRKYILQDAQEKAALS